MNTNEKEPNESEPIYIWPFTRLALIFGGFAICCCFLTAEPARPPRSSFEVVRVPSIVQRVDGKQVIAVKKKRYMAWWDLPNGSYWQEHVVTSDRDVGFYAWRQVLHHGERVQYSPAPDFDFHGHRAGAKINREDLGIWQYQDTPFGLVFVPLIEE